jgi:DNA (cytosine-5)-methyltransferase 1
MKIKFSKRGLTFSFKANETFKAGTKYRYIVDNKNSEVILLPDENGKYKLSKKGSQGKPLVDLRNEEIREAMSMARYMEVEVMDDKIIIRIIKTSVSFDTLSDVEIADVIKKSDEVTFSIDKEQLKTHSTALSDMLTSAGLFSAKTRDDVSYVFDTVSLFCGAGLLDFPFSKDGSFDIKYAIDYNKHACETYRENIGNHVVCKDIREVEPEDIPDADLVIGGPCCQPFSSANRSKNEERNTERRRLIEDYVRLTKAKKPLCFVIENTPELFIKDKGKWLQLVLNELADYNITYSIVNDDEVGGYSTRRRAVIIGSSKEVGKIIIPNVELTGKKTVRDAFSKITSDWYNYPDQTISRENTQKSMSYVRPGHNYKDIPESVQKFGKSTQSNTFKRLAWDEPSCTILNWRKARIMPPEGNRVLSVAEAASLMGLNKDFKFLGNLDARQQQCANGVTQAMAHFIKSIVKNALYGYANKSLRRQLAIA